MNLYKNFHYTKGRNLWRLIPAGKNLLVIEERDITTREVFYSCIEMSTGKSLFSDFQTEDKLWSGVEDIYRGFIYFHKYAKPDMPMHSGITAFDINKREVVWKNEDYVFAFIVEDKLYCYQSVFEGKKYFELDYATGELLREIGEDQLLINKILATKKDEGMLEGYMFPDTYIEGRDSNLDEVIASIKENFVIAGSIDLLKTGSIAMISYHTVNDDGSLTNRFNCIEIGSKKIILEEVLNKKITSFMPDSFFICNDLIFLLVEKEELLVYLIN